MQYCNYDISSDTSLDFEYQAAPNLNSCMDSCDATNSWHRDNNCQAVEYHFAGTAFLLCFLKNGTGTLELNILATPGEGNYSVSAVLQ